MVNVGVEHLENIKFKHLLLFQDQETLYEQLTLQSNSPYVAVWNMKVNDTDLL